MVDKNFVWIVFLLFQVNPASFFSSFPESAIGANLTEQRHLRPRRQSQLDCNKLKQHDTVEAIITAQCKSLEAPAGSTYEFKIKGVETGWNTLFSGLTYIVNINFVFDGTSVTTIAINGLSTSVNSSLTIQNNNDLTLIELQSGAVFQLRLVVKGNPTLKTIKLGAVSLRLIAPIFRIEDNSHLETIDMGNLTNIELTGDFILYRNEKLKEINMESLSTFKADNLVLSKNFVLDKFDLPKLKDLTVNGAFIKKNNKLATINFNPNGTFSMSSLIIEQNDKLANIAIEEKNVKNLKVTISGNRVLSNDSLKLLGQTTTKDSKVQKFGECIFDDGPIKLLSELDDCVIITGGVNFTSSIIGSVSKSGILKTINGDVDLDGLKQSHAAAVVALLSNAQINGEIRSSICDFKLGHHPVSSPTCPTTKASITRATTASPAAVTTVAPSGQQASSAGESSSSTSAVIGGVAGGVIVVIVIIVVVVCLFVPVSIGGAKKARKVKLYKKVFPCFKKKDSPPASATTLTTPSSEDVKNGKEEKTTKKPSKPRVSAGPKAQTSNAPRMARRLPGMTQLRTAKSTGTGEQSPQSTQADTAVEMPGEPQNVPQAQPPRASEEPPRKKPRLSYQHDLLQRMEEFLVDSDNYNNSTKGPSTKE